MTPLELRRRRRARTSRDLWKQQTVPDSRLGIAHEKYIAVMATTAYSQFNQEKEMTQHYIGTKQITAWPQDQVDGDGNVKPGYAVKYEDGYTSWSPKTTFEAAYRVIEGAEQALTFGDALQMLKAGKKVARTGWNGKGMFVYLVQGSTFAVNRPPLLGIYAEGTTINYNAHIDIKGADGSVSTWVPSIGDCLATDWQVVE